MCACRVAVVSVTRSKARRMDEVFKRANSPSNMCAMAFHATAYKNPTTHVSFE